MLANILILGGRSSQSPCLGWRDAVTFIDLQKINNVSLLINQLSYHKFQRKKIINQLSYHKSTEKIPIVFVPRKSPAPHRLKVWRRLWGCLWGGKDRSQGAPTVKLPWANGRSSGFKNDGGTDCTICLGIFSIWTGHEKWAFNPDFFWFFVPSLMG